MGYEHPWEVGKKNQLEEWTKSQLTIPVKGGLEGSLDSSDWIFDVYVGTAKRDVHTRSLPRSVQDGQLVGKFDVNLLKSDSIETIRSYRRASKSAMQNQ